MLGIAGRMLAYPLNRDENMFVSVATQVGYGDLYRDLGYNHLPNLAYLLSTIYSAAGTEHFLLAGRIAMMVGWLLTVLALWLIVRRLQLGVDVFFAAVALIAGSVLLLGPSGMLVSNNFLPIPCILFAFYFLLGALGGELPRSHYAFVAGIMVSVTIGFKANYIMLAPLFALTTLCAPGHRQLRERIVTGFVPLAIGGLIGGIPTLAHLALDPEGFVAHTLRYFTELQTAYWNDADGPKSMGMSDKVLLAEQIWLRDTPLLAIASCFILSVAAILNSGVRALIDWRVILLVGLAACGGVLAFLPTPSFPQYFVPPIPFLVLLVLVLASIEKERNGQVVAPLMIAVAVLGLVSGGSRLALGLLEFRDPGAWESIALKREVEATGAQAGLAPGAQVATMTPVFALEGGYAIYPEFAAGQFVYRVAPYISEADRAYYRTTSPKDLQSFLDSDPPDAILVNRAEPIERPLAAYAASRGYTRHENANVADGFDLYVASE
jgi:hypothetical protein